MRIGVEVGRPIDGIGCVLERRAVTLVAVDVLLRCTTSGERSELVSAMLLELGATAVTEHPVDDGVEIHAGFASNSAALEAMSAINDLGTSSIETATPDWVENQRDGLAPVEVAQWRIRAPWHPRFPDADDDADADDRVEIIIDPGAAFGHGAHPSTALILALLPHITNAGDEIVDVGTGTGILAVAAAKLGARVLAVDNSPAAVGMAIANAGTNDVSEAIVIELMDAAELDVSHVVTALVNVTLDAHRHIAPALRSVPLVVISGILDGQVDEAAALYAEHRVDRTFTYGEWSALVLQRSGQN